MEQEHAEPERRVDCTEDLDVNGFYIWRGGGAMAPTRAELAKVLGVREDQLDWKPNPALQKRATRLAQAKRRENDSDPFWDAFHGKK